jgi:colicin import membrane protein
VELPKLAEPIAPPKTDIELAVKKIPKVKPQEPPSPVEMKPVQPTKTEPVKVEQKVPAVPDAVSEQERVRAAQAAATSKLVDEFKFRIMAKIRRNIVMPLDVQDNMMAIFDVILIPGGTVISSKLAKPSGSPAYDDAVDRAISKAQPLPVPPDVALFNRFRELHLTFTPKEKE